MQLRHIFTIGMALSYAICNAGVVNVGSGSYSDAFPGVDAAGRNAYPAGEPQVSGRAATRPIPTNDWWSSELINNHGNTIFNYPMGLQPMDNGLKMVNPVLGGAMPADSPVVIGLSGLNAQQTTVCDHSDWTVSINWSNRMTATAGMGMPFVYFEKSDNSDVVVNIGMGGARAEGNILIISGSYNGASYAVYAPSGASWQLNGGTATSNLAGKNYWSAVMFPAGADASALASDWAKYAYVFPADTRADFTYDENAGRVIAQYSVTPDVKEGSASTVLMGLLPHHYNNLQGSVNFIGTQYQCIRGQLRMAATNTFATSLRYSGVLPTIPAAQTASTGYDSAELRRLADATFTDNGLSDWTDSYNDGQLLNRLVQVARICKEIGYEAGFTRGMNLVKNHLERWLSYSQGDIAFMFYYHKPFTALLGYPAGHGQDGNINDHHFHWGYFIHAASFVEQYNPGWAANWGEMVGMLVRDAASTDRNDPMFPYLRSFSPYAGHCWANGFATIGIGNDQESTSESMQFNCSLIHWGALTGNKAVRDLGICLYTIERSATEEYWFNVNGAVASNGKALYSRIFGNAHDSDNFWGAAIEGSYGIQIYPVHAGSFYLVNHPDYARKLWNAMCNETAILSNAENGNIWYDSWIQFLSMIDPAEAVRLYNSCTQLGKKFGCSQAQTYQQVHAMAAIGVPRQDITANYPLATAFEKDGITTYAAQNYSDQTVTVRFSDGFELVCPPRKLTTGSGTSVPLPQDAYVSVTLSASTAKPGDNIDINVSIDEGDHTIVSSAIKVNGETVSTLSHRAPAARAAKPHNHQWTAPDEAGEYTVTAEATSSEGRIFTSSPMKITVTAEPTDPDIPGPVDPVDPTPGGSGCSYTGSESDGTGLYGGYTMQFTTEGSSIVIRVKYLGEYIGNVPPFIQSEGGNGFREYGQATDAGDGWYTYTIANAEQGRTYRAMMPYTAGGMAITAYHAYNPGQNCGGTTSTGEIADDLIALYPNPAHDVVTIDVPGICDVIIYSPSGAAVWSATVDTRATVEVGSWSAGIYFVRFINADGDSNVLTMIKR